MLFTHIVVLAVIQGLTEFLPVSSSAHLVLPSKVLGWPDQGLGFDIACHIGTLLAVMAFYRAELLRICSDVAANALLRKEQTPLSRLGWYIFWATIPVGLIGAALGGWIEDSVRQYAVLVIALNTIVFGIFLWIADVYGTKHAKDAVSLENMGFRRAFLIGLSQAFALLPGASRSGTSISAALFLGLDRKDAAKYSFLLSIPLIMAAGLYSTLKMIKSGEAADWSSMGLGIVLSFVCAYAVIAFFMKFISKIGMMPFVWYRFVLGGALLAYWFFC